MIMSNQSEDDRIKAFVAALTLALQNIVVKPLERAGSKRKPPKHKKPVRDKAKRADHQP
jgi:hypothetical protein